jgi:hypothetical protein
MGTASPPLRSLQILRIGAGRGEPVWAGAAIFEQGSFGRTKPSAKQMTLVDGMKRVDKHHAPSEWKSSRDTTAAKLRDNVSFGNADEAGLGHPCRQFAKELFIHVATIQMPTSWVSATMNQSELTPSASR